MCALQNKVLTHADTSAEFGGFSCRMHARLRLFLNDSTEIVLKCAQMHLQCVWMWPKRIRMYAKRFPMSH